MSRTLKEIISNVCDGDVDFSDRRMPEGLCNGCRLRLYAAKNDKSEPPKLFDPSTVEISTSASQSQNCDCRLCQIGRATLMTPRPKKVGAQPKKKPDRCGNCLGEIVGYSHTCKEGARRQNLLALAAGDEVGLQQIMSNYVQNAAKSPRAKSVHLSQAQGGR